MNLTIKEASRLMHKKRVKTHTKPTSYSYKTLTLRGFTCIIPKNLKKSKKRGIENEKNKNREIS